MHVDLTECVHKLFADLDIDDLVASLTAPPETEVELTGSRVEQPINAPGR